MLKLNKVNRSSVYFLCHLISVRFVGGGMSGGSSTAYSFDPCFSP